MPAIGAPQPNIKVSKNNPPLLFKYGQGDDQESRSPAVDLKLRKKGGTPIKLARQRVVARCVRELFKELAGIPTAGFANVTERD